MNRVFLSIAGVVTSAVAIAACTGQERGNEPCCPATGTVEGPPTFVATSNLSAEAITLNLDAPCIDLVAGGLEVEVERRVSDPQPVVGNRYTLELNRHAVGRPVFIRIFDTDNRTIAFGSVPREPEEGVSLTISPIRFFADPSRVGESTLEMVGFCTLARPPQPGATPEIGALTLSDIRAAITSSMAAAFTRDAASVGLTLGYLRSYRDAISELTSASTTPDALRLARTRGEFEADILRDELGDSVVGEIAAAQVRVGLLVSDSSIAFADGQPTLKHLLTFAQDLNSAIDSVAAPTDDAPPLVRSAYTTNQSFRAALTNVAFRQRATGAGVGFPPDIMFEDTGAGVRSLNDLLAFLLVSVATEPSLSGTKLRWSVFATEVDRNLLRQEPAIDPFGNLPATRSLSVSSSEAATLAIGNDPIAWPHDRILRRLYDGGAGDSGVWQDIRTEVEARHGGLSTEQKEVLADFLFYSSINRPPY